MKSSIIFSYDIANEFCIGQVVGLTANSAVVLAESNDTEEVNLILLEGDKYYTKNISKELPALDKYKIGIKTLMYNIVIFKYNQGFGLLIHDYLYLWDTFYSNYTEYKIKNHFEKDVHNRVIGPVRASAVESRNEILVTLSDYGCPIDVARYYCTLKIQNDFAEWLRPERQLKLEEFSVKTASTKKWSVIQDAVFQNDMYYIHTVGEDMNHYKFGMSCSVLCDNDINGEIVKTRNIEKGFGFFSSMKEYLIIHSLKNKSKLYFYGITKEFEDILSLTPKQNLGNGDKYFIKCDVIGNTLWIYNAEMLNCCQLKIK